MSNINETPHNVLITSVKLYCDGGSRGNPGPAASGYVLFDDSDRECASGGEYLGVATNNQAEYKSLIIGMTRALEMGVQTIVAYMDSQLAVKQINGEYKVKNPGLQMLYRDAKKLTKQFQQFSIKHVPRDMNTAADRVVNIILDENVT